MSSERWQPVLLPPSGAVCSQSCPKKVKGKKMHFAFCKHVDAKSNQEAAVSGKLFTSAYTFTNYSCS